MSGQPIYILTCVHCLFPFWHTIKSSQSPKVGIDNIHNIWNDKLILGHVFWTIVKFQNDYCVTFSNLKSTHVLYLVISD